MTELAMHPSQILPVRDKVAIVTGGASGIGAAVVKLLSDHGAYPWFCDINTMAGEAFAASVPNARFIYADVTDWHSLYSFFRDVHATTGHIDIVFANAGYIQSASIWDDKYAPNGELQEPTMSTLDVTLKGVIYTAKLAISFFRRNPLLSPSALVFTASASSYNERPNLPLYSVSKHGVIALMRSLRVLAPSENVHVAAVAPGGTLTNMVTSSIAARMEAVGVHVQQADYVALALLILASNPEYNGQCWALLGGRCTEVEGPIRRLMPQWFGEWNTDQANKVTNITWQK